MTDNSGGESPPRETPDEVADDPAEQAGPNVQAMGHWDQVVADMEATAADYEDRGWETLQLHPGDVAVVTPGEYEDRTGLDVLVPDDEYEQLEAAVDAGVEFDAYQVFKAASGGMVFLLVAMEDRDEETAVLFPAYYQATHPDTQELFELAHEAGQLHSYLRRLDGMYVVLNHDEPELFEPPEEGGEADEE